MKIRHLKISETATKVINDYKHLDFGQGVRVTCPYYLNSLKHHKNRLRALSGKGLPQEIVDETKINAHLFGFDWLLMTRANLRSFMEKNGIGIDCSGFVLWVYQLWFREDYSFNLFKKIRQRNRNHPIKWLRLLLRPAQNINVLELTCARNAGLVKNIDDIRPGDCVRAGDMVKGRGGYHIFLITEVEMVGARVKKIRYYHSAEKYGLKNGIKKGEIEIIQPKKGLESQLWKEIDASSKNKRNWTKEAFLNDDGQNGVYRLKLA